MVNKNGVNKDKVDDRHEDKKKNLPTFFESQNLIRADYLIFRAKKNFNFLWNAFIKAPVFHHFDLEHHIYITINVSNYGIGKDLSQLITNFLGQWHLIDYYLHRMIPAETCYKTQNDKFLVIVKAFNTWQYYIKDYKYKILVLINYNNVCCFINPKNLSF